MITIKREPIGMDKLRKYDINLDGKVIDSIGRDEIKSFDVDPGTHILYLQIDWGKSNKITFEQKSKENKYFKCRSRPRGLEAIFWFIYLTILFNRYLKLEQVEHL